MNTNSAVVIGEKKGGERGRHTGNWAMMDWNCGGESTPESRRYSSSVRQVESERLIAAVSGILVR